MFASVGLALIFGGIFLMWVVVTGRPVLDTIRGVVAR